MSTGGLKDRLEKYKKKARVLRQINSNKKEKYNRLNKAASIITVVVASIIAFIGFMGEQKITAYAQLIYEDVGITTVSFVFNIFILIILVTIFVDLLFRFSEKESDHQRAIVILTSLINDIDDILEVREIRSDHIKLTIQNVRSKYELITESIPPHSDGDFIQAKADMMEKKDKSKEIEKKYEASVNKRRPSRVSSIEDIKSIILHDPWMMKVLKAVRDSLGSEFWVSGGFVRNKIWDILHNYDIRTPLDDIDVIYYDDENVQEENEEVYESKLRDSYPNLPWQVKNQARMHTITGDEQYTSLEDALRKWPERCTAIAVRVDEENNIREVSPHGVEDLISLIVRPTSHFEDHLERYTERIENKNWEDVWKRLNIYRP